MVIKKNRLLVTGGAGYIGSHTIKELLRVGYESIVVVDDLSAGYKERVPKEVKFIKGDFTDKSLLEEGFANGIDSVLHFAASKLAPESVIDPQKYYINNVKKSLELLDYCVQKGVKNFIFSSSAAVYGDVEGCPITESFPTMPTNPYGWTKLMIEQALLDYSNAYDIKHVSLRYFNAGGADPEGELGNNHQKGEDVISILMRSAINISDFTIFGADYDTKDGTCVRDLIHVTDLATAHVNALSYLEDGGCSLTVNLGSEEGFTVREIAEITKDITGSQFQIVNGPRREGDIVVSIASSEKAKKVLGWNKKFSDIETLISTSWYWEKNNSNLYRKI